MKASVKIKGILYSPCKIIKYKYLDCQLGESYDCSLESGKSKYLRKQDQKPD